MSATKSTGVVRKIDELGRIVLPSELRKVLGIHEGDPLEISVQGESIILQKYRDVCVFCAAESPMVEHKGRKMCESCAEQIAVTTGRIEISLPEDEPVGA